MTQGGDCLLSWQTADFFTISQRKTAENSTPDVRDWSGIEPCSIPGLKRGRDPAHAAPHNCDVTGAQARQIKLTRLIAAMLPTTKILNLNTRI